MFRIMRENEKLARRIASGAPAVSGGMGGMAARGAPRGVSRGSNYSFNLSDEELAQMYGAEVSTCTSCMIHPMTLLLPRH